jgi:hypothetical protein
LEQIPSATLIAELEEEKDIQCNDQIDIQQ